MLLDLVGTACSALRKNFAKELLKIHVPSVLKGNMSELLAMIEEESHAVGIDAGEKDSITDENRNRLTRLLQKKADEWNTVFLIRPYSWLFIVLTIFNIKKISNSPSLFVYT